MRYSVRLQREGFVLAPRISHHDLAVHAGPTTLARLPEHLRPSTFGYAWAQRFRAQQAADHLNADV